MALNSYAHLTAAGTALDGDTSIQSIGGVDVSADHLECFEVRWGSRVSGVTTSGRSRGQVEKLPVTLLKPIDKTTPLLYQALAQNQRIDGEIKLFDANPDTGETRHRFTLAVSQARIVAIESVSPDTQNPDTASLPQYETVELLPHTITYTDEVNSVAYQDRATAVKSTIRPTRKPTRK